MASFDASEGSGDNLGISVLVSAGIHPASGRARRAQLDARAVELGLQLVGSKLQLLHAGDPDNPCLRDYLGMGIPAVQVLPLSSDLDPVAGLVWQLQQDQPEIILAGCTTEQGNGSGLLPYVIATKLARPLVNNIVGFHSLSHDYAEVLQALPRGQRRILRVKLPFVATVDKAAPSPRQSAFAVAQRGVIDAIAIPPEIVAQANTTGESLRQVQPARKRPRRLKAALDSGPTTAATRFKAATAKQANAGNRVIENQSPQEQAQAIFSLLLEEGVIR